MNEQLPKSYSNEEQPDVSPLAGIVSPLTGLANGHEEYDSAKQNRDDFTDAQAARTQLLEDLDTYRQQTGEQRSVAHARDLADRALSLAGNDNIYPAQATDLLVKSAADIKRISATEPISSELSTAAVDQIADRFENDPRHKVDEMDLALHTIEHTGPTRSPEAAVAGAALGGELFPVITDDDLSRSYRRHDTDGDLTTATRAGVPTGVAIASADVHTRVKEVHPSDDTPTGGADMKQFFADDELDETQPAKVA